MTLKNSYTAVDLFCGAGGLSYGFSRAGCNVIAGFDNCESALKTFSYNHSGAEAIIADLSRPIEQIERYKHTDIVIGGPPCQGFSISGKRDPDDIRNKLYVAYVHALTAIKPKLFIMENVPNLVSMDGGNLRKKMIMELTNLGYHVTYKVLNSSFFGVPQNRKRVFIVGYKHRPINLIERLESNIIPCVDAISDLPSESLNDGEKYPEKAISNFQTEMRKNSSGVWNHQITNHKEKTVKIISLVPDGGNYKDLPQKYKNTRKVNVAWTRYNSKKPSYTIDTGHRHHFHYKYNRVPTVRESARLQSFPDDFIFFGSKTNQYKQVGNAVPPLIAEAIAKFIMEEMDNGI